MADGDLFVEVDEYVESGAGLLLRLGPLWLPTTLDALSRVLGQQASTDGGIVAAGERQARGFTPTIPLHGEATDTDMRETGLRLRRQVAALINNRRATDQGLFFDFGPDPWMNLWLQIGAAEVKNSAGGITMGDFVLTISDAYELGTLQTHRPGRQFAVADRRVATTAIDTRATVYTSDYPAQTVRAVAALPSGITDVTLRTGEPATLHSRPGRDGPQLLLLEPENLDTITFEPGADQYLNSVRVLDRRTFRTAPAAGDDPNWETVYGPTQTLVDADDAPVLDNGLCRARWDTQGTAVGYALDAWTEDGWEEQGKVYVFRTAFGLNTLLSARLTEWTPERAVVTLVLANTADPSARDELLVTLERGWTAPRFELYPAPPLSTSGLVFATLPTDTDITWIDGASVHAVTEATPLPAIVGTGFVTSNCALMVREDRPLALQMCVQLGETLYATQSAIAYGAAAFETMIVTGTHRYHSVHYGFGVSDAINDSLTGIVDFAVASLIDTQAIPILVAR
jgi:hypothetical protein